MHIRPKTPREKIWALLITLGVLSGLTSLAGPVEMAGYLAGAFIFYMIPIVLAPVIYSALGQLKQKIVSNTS